jgi:hypothetical protein
VGSPAPPTEHVDVFPRFFELVLQNSRFCFVNKSCENLNKMLHFLKVTAAVDLTWLLSLVVYGAACANLSPVFSQHSSQLASPRLVFVSQKPNFKKKCILCYYAIMRSLEMSNLN